ncbi:MAG: 1-acyl-sn-glycerol-3-phosphate acyltransferase [Lachnospiraceae bacterium]|nr:1-acyl-sn-glycerol-3-phosphate acyltransferase [Lachnospiraceae bacterium]
MIRLFLIAVFLCLFFVLSIPILGILWIMGKINKPVKDIVSLRIVQWVFKVILFLSGVKTTVIGMENVPKDEAVLYIGNHNSYFDTLTLYSRTPGLTGFISKKEIGCVPILCTWMKNLYCLFLDRDNIKEGFKTILEGIEHVKNGISIVIFPEGSRSEDGEIGEFKEGSLRIAKKAGCKIIPVAQNNTRAVFEAQFPFIKAAHTVLEFGTPIDVETLDKDEKKFLGASTRKIIEEMYEKNKNLV